KPGKPCFRYSAEGGGLSESGAIAYGELKLLALDVGQTAKVVVEPARGFDAGAGPGRRIEREVRGGTVGLILDGRGRPLVLSTDRAAARVDMERWVDALGLYRQPEPAGV
ncbi:MAG: methylaspartate mutase, partial [Planctomycetes bacterium]|nr:methylaspartate mutase [Planctomycetota bacterium]